jgi:hypothetical protein
MPVDYDVPLIGIVCITDNGQNILVHRLTEPVGILTYEAWIKYHAVRHSAIPQMKNQETVVEMVEVTRPDEYSRAS